MKLATAIILLLLWSFFASASKIPIGYHSQFAKVWRFFEQDGHGNWTPKILVYNITDTPITFCLKVVLSHDLTVSDKLTLKEQTGLDNDTIVGPINIPANGYGIYETDALITDISTGFYDRIFINGQAIGIMRVRGKLQFTNKRHRYYSYEGIDGIGYCLIGTDNLFVRPGEVGHVSLYYRTDVTKRLYPVNEWQFEPYVENGIASVTVCKEDGQCFTADTDKPKVNFPVNIEKLDSFVLEADYMATRGDSFPEVCLTNHFCSGCGSVIMLPIFLK